MQKRQARYYDRSSRDLPVLHECGRVRMKPFQLGDKSWKKATIVERLDERSYDVEDTDGTVYRRNRVHLEKTREIPPTPVMPIVESLEACNTPPASTQQQGPALEKKQATSTPRRSTRTAHVPDKYHDYVLSK